MHVASLNLTTLLLLLLYHAPSPFTDDDMSKNSGAPAETCPVDAETRAAWLKSRSSITTFPGASIDASKASQGNSCDSSQIDQSPPPPKGLFSKFLSPSSEPSPSTGPKGLGVDREISTIPRASPVDSADGANPANSERESGVSESGNWIYPSERMFFEAMKHKGYQTEAENMKTIGKCHHCS
jgi:cytochrome c heme-lyase